MQESKKTYKEGDLVKIRTNKCNVHLMEMFGHCEFYPDEITADEYIALITAVIGNEQCYSVPYSLDTVSAIMLLTMKKSLVQRALMNYLKTSETRLYGKIQLTKSCLNLNFTRTIVLSQILDAFPLQLPQ